MARKSKKKSRQSPITKPATRGSSKLIEDYNELLTKLENTKQPSVEDIHSNDPKQEAINEQAADSSPGDTTQILSEETVPMALQLEPDTQPPASNESGDSSFLIPPDYEVENELKERFKVSEELNGRNANVSSRKSRGFLWNCAAEVCEILDSTAFPLVFAIVFGLLSYYSYIVR